MWELKGSEVYHNGARICSYLRPATQQDIKNLQRKMGSANMAKKSVKTAVAVETPVVTETAPVKSVAVKGKKATPAATPTVETPTPVKGKKATAATPAADPAPVKGKGKKSETATAPVATESTKVDGLTKNQARILQFIKDNGPCDRPAIKAGTGLQGGLAKIMGAPTKAIGSDTLEGMGYIKSSKEEGQRSMTYTITPAGLKALGK